MVEMKLKLHTVEYVVFDEADRSVGRRGLGHGGSKGSWGVAGLSMEGPNRCCHVLCALLCRLFEMGFAEQLQEIIARLPDAHQTVLFSATLPKLLVEFARAGEEHGTDGGWGAGPGGAWGWGSQPGSMTGLSSRLAELCRVEAIPSG